MSERIHTPEDYARQAAETKLLAKLTIKCKECSAKMSTGLTEGKRYYYCGNNTGHEDNLDRYVYLHMPKYLLDEAIEITEKVPYVDEYDS